MQTRHITLLLVEDNPGDARLVRAMLQQDAHSNVGLAVTRLHVADRLSRAIECLEQQRFDIILLDLSLPDAKGLEALQQLHKITPQTPIIVMSGMLDAEMAAGALQAGAQDYLVKGHVDEHLLMRAMRYARERMDMSKALEMSLLFNQAILSSLTVHLAVLDADGTILMVNEAWTRFAQANGDPWGNQTGVGVNYLDVLRRSAQAGDETAGGVAQEIQKLLHGAQDSFSCEYPCHSPTEERWFLMNVTPLPGNLVGAVVAHEPITVQIKAKDMAMKSETRLRSLFNSVPVGLYRSRPDGRMLEANPTLAEILGYATPDELLAEEFVQKFYADPAQHAEQHLHVEAHGLVQNREIALKGADGRLIWVLDSFRAIEDEAGEISYEGSLQDITERKLAEQALQASDQKFRSVLDNSRDIIYQVNLETGTFDYLSPSVTGSLGFSAEEMIAGGIRGLVARLHPDDAPNLARHTDDLVDKVNHHTLASSIQYRLLTASGMYRWFSDTRQVLYNSQERPVALVGNVRDITDQKHRELELEASLTLSNSLRTATTHQELLPILVEQFSLIFDAPTTALALHEPASDKILVKAARGEWARWEGSTLPVDSVSAQVLKSGQAFVTDDARHEPLLKLEDGSTLQAVTCRPLLTSELHERLIGVIWLGRSTPFSAHEHQLLNTLSSIAADSLQRTILYEESQRSVARLGALRRIDMAITGSVDLRVTANILLAEVLTQLGVDAAQLLRFNASSQLLEPIAAQGFRTTALRHAHLRLGEGFAGKAALERTLIHVPDLIENPGNLGRSPRLTEERFVSYYAVPLIGKGRVRGVLEIFHRTPHHAGAEWLEFLEALAGQAAIAVESSMMFDELQHSNLELRLAYDATIEGWSRALDLRDEETEGHSRRVTEMTVQLARMIGITGEELLHVRWGALLHDIGKMGVPDQILLKPGKLSAEEWEIMRRHPQYAYEMLSSITFLRNALDIPYCHHERWDGTGYPRGLEGEHIPLAARVFAVVDVWDALTSNRPYRDAWTPELARDYIFEQSGSHFDPQIVRLFLDLVRGW